jgi:hypothetical protein
MVPRKRWEPGSPDLPVEPLNARDGIVKGHFSNPEVQYIGSTLGCGCGFPHVMFRGGAWPYFEDPEVDGEQIVTDHLNRERLVGLLRSTGEPTVELYGIWDGDFAKAPEAHETVPLETILNPDFRLKERGFYRVLINPD